MSCCHSGKTLGQYSNKEQYQRLIRVTAVPSVFATVFIVVPPHFKEDIAGIEKTQQIAIKMVRALTSLM